MGGTLPTQTYHQIARDSDFESFRNKLKLKQIEAKENFQKKHPQAEKFFNERKFDLSRIRETSAKLLGTGAITGTLLLTPPGDIKKLPEPGAIVQKLKERDVNIPFKLPQEYLIEVLKKVLPEKVRPLTREEEKSLEQVFGEVMGLKVRANLEGEHLNTTYGLIGAEQHLRRYPGDVLSYHGEGDALKEGIAPGLGAWGYFARSKSDLTPDLVETEKWYAVVQTLYLPDWGKRQPYLRDWYKYRKVIIVNTQNGKGVVAAIADAGPAAWTGKHFGGSPEVMDYLGGPRYKKGPVIVFFVDDPDNKIPLGPIEYNSKNILLTKA